MKGKTTCRESAVRNKTRRNIAQAQSLTESAYRYELRSGDFLFEGLGIADLAHTAMLLKTGVIKKNIGKSILKKLQNFQRVPISKLSLDPAKGDIYSNREKLLTKRLGRLSHYIHTGRARREATTIALLLACRSGIAELGLSLGSLCRTMLKLARKHSRSYMTDYTYLQHAHPTTLGHYLLGYLYPLMRDMERLRNLYTIINQSPAGSGSVNGSLLPLDRGYLKSLMEFNDVITHTRDAMWRHDVIIEAAVPLLTILTTISRLSEDLMIWNTREFGFIELSHMHTRKSVIMPQKKNPYSLAFIRGLGRNMIGRFVGIVSTGHTSSGQPDNRIFVHHDLPDCIRETKKAVDLLTDILRHCSFDKKRLYKSAREGFTVATDIADYIVSHSDIDNRTAYAIVSKAAGKLRNIQNGTITPELIYSSAREIGASLPAIFDKNFENSFKVERLLEERKGIGGASRSSMNAMTRECGNLISRNMKFFLKREHGAFTRRFLDKINRIIERA
jgi:argininosuccinate lyase